MPDIGVLLSTIRNLDFDRDVFGANQHQYRSTPVLDADIVSFERRYDIKLPGRFREFLMEVGVGAGPYYGLLGLEEMMHQIETCWTKQSARPPSPSAAFPFTRQDAVSVCQRLNADKNESRIVGAFPCNGCIPICHHGCSLSSWLVVTGQLRGCVWDVANDIRGEGLWMPSCCPPGLELHLLSRYTKPKELPELTPFTTFQAWLESWLNRCLEELNLIRTS